MLFGGRCLFSPDLSWCCFYENGALSLGNSFSFNLDLDLFISITVCFPVCFLCSSKFERAPLSWHFIWARFWI